MYPEIQKKAKEELDLVVGPDRLPTYEDSDSLPYIQAILMECARWLPPGPLGIPRRATTDDYYKGYLIPEGTVILTVRTVICLELYKIFTSNTTECLVGGILIANDCCSNSLIVVSLAY